jgi:hypothetical protein
VERKTSTQKSGVQGAQEMSVPVRKGGSPRAPDGGHSSHAGTLPEPEPVALAADPPVLVRGAGADGVLPPLSDWPLAAPPPEPVGAELDNDPVAAELG